MERTTGEKQKRRRILCWSVYLVGAPAWLTIFAIERNWIAGAAELGGTLSMVLGVVIAVRGKGNEPRWIDWVARLAVAIGLAYSVYDFGGIKAITQLLELGLVTGFLFGTYLLAKQRPAGYPCFMLMNASNAFLMGIEGYPWLVFQQLISLGFVLDAYLTQKRRARAKILAADTT